MERLRVAALGGDGWGPIDLVVEAGACLCVSGPSGAGKTRLLRAIADLDVHTGSAFLDGVAAQRIAPPLWRRRVALLPADSRWWAETVAEHFPRDAQPDFDAVGLPDETPGWRIERLSSGERQRLALLRLLANTPQVLLLDEPTANLDARSATRVEALIAAYRHEHQAAVLWVSHDPEQIERVAGGHVRLERGRVATGAGATA